MTTYTEKQLRELDAWILEHSKQYPEYDIELNVFCLRLLGWKDIRPCSKFGPALEGIYKGGETFFDCPFVTSDNDTSMQVLEKCAEKVPVSIRKQFSKKWCVWMPGQIDGKPESFSETLPLAICEFAKQLFSK